MAADPSVTIECPCPEGVLTTTKYHDVTIANVPNDQIARIQLIFADTDEAVDDEAGATRAISGNDYAQGVIVVNGGASFRVKPNILSSQYDGRKFAYAIDVAETRYRSEIFKLVTKAPRKRPKSGDEASDVSVASELVSDLDCEELTAMLSDVSPISLDEIGARLVRIEQVQQAMLLELQHVSKSMRRH